MKTAIICGICEKPRRESESYAIKLTDYNSGDVIQLSDGRGTILSSKSRKIRACRACTKRMGYKIKASKPKAKKEVRS